MDGGLAPSGDGTSRMARPRHIRQALAALVASAALGLSLAGCSLPFGLPGGSGQSQGDEAPAPEPAVSDAALVQAGTLTVGVPDESANAPYYIVGDDGGVSGMDVDLASALAERLGLEVRFVSVDDAGDALGTSCDVVLGAEEGDVAGAVVEGSTSQAAVALFRRGEAGVATLDEVSGATVGVQEGSVSQGVLEGSNLEVTARTYSNLNEAFNALEAGTIDYVLCDAYSGAYLAVAYGDLAFAGTLDEPVSRGVAMAEGNDELVSAVSGALGELSGNGVVGLVRARWVGTLPDLTSETVVPGVTLSQTSGATDAEGGDEDAGDGESATDAGETFSEDSAPMDGSTAGSNAATL